MSKQRFKIELTYDDHYGNQYNDLTRETLYMVENNSSDYINVVNKDGYTVDLVGPDGYIECLCQAILYRNCNEKVEIKGEITDMATVEPIGYSDFPDKVKEVLK